MKLGRFLFCVASLSGIVFALDAQALGLGEATLESRLNEPLSVEIALLGANSDTATPIAKVVTGAEHAAVGVAASGLLSQLRVEISGDATRIRITTQQSIREPVLIFTLKVEYARESKDEHWFTALASHPSDLWVGLSSRLVVLNETRKVSILRCLPVWNSIRARRASTRLGRSHARIPLK